MSLPPGQQQWYDSLKNEKNWSQVIENKNYSSQALSISGKKKVLLKNLDFTVNKSDGSMCTVSNCQDVLIDGCKFHDKNTLGVALKIAGGSTKRILVRNCEFFNLSYSQSNGGEPVRVGNSHSSGCWFDVVIEDCYFHNLAADPETVSIKACGVTIRNCRHENNKSSFVIRHGGFANILANKFKGEGGIRVYGYGNTIVGNHFQDNQSTNFPPLTLGAGNTEKDPNFTKVDTPSGKDVGNSHAMYVQINNNTITDNTYRNCKTTIKRRTDNPLKPINSKIDELKEGDPSTTPPIPPPPIPPPPPPDTPPTETPAVKLLCDVCKQEEATARLSVLVGPKHREQLKQAMIRDIKDLKAGGATQ